jgi:hypothetical protein
MDHPELDLARRQPVWDCMQHFWMDTDPAELIPHIAQVCAASTYTLEELEAIFWNEVRPAVSSNVLALPAPQWSGFELADLTERVLRKQRFGKRLPTRWLRPYARRWWDVLRPAIVARRSGVAGR